MPPRTVLRNHTDRNDRCEASRCSNQNVSVGRSTRLVAPTGRRRPRRTGGLECGLRHHGGADTQRPGSSKLGSKKEDAKPPKSADIEGGRAVAGLVPAPTPLLASIKSISLETSKLELRCRSVGDNRAGRLPFNARTNVGIIDGMTRGPSQMSVGATRRSVSATPSIIRRTGDETAGDSGLMLAHFVWHCPATHSTRPTSLARATAPATAPVGGYGVAANWAWVDGQLGPPPWWRLRGAAALSPAGVGACGEVGPPPGHRGGKPGCAVCRAMEWATGTMQAVVPHATGDSPPNRVTGDRPRPAGWATATGRTNIKSTPAVDPVASCGEDDPRGTGRSNPTTAIRLAPLATLCMETIVPTCDEATSDEHGGPRRRANRTCRGNGPGSPPTTASRRPRRPRRGPLAGSRRRHARWRRPPASPRRPEPSA